MLEALDHTNLLIHDFQVLISRLNLSYQNLAKFISVDVLDSFQRRVLALQHELQLSQFWLARQIQNNAQFTQASNARRILQQQQNCFLGQQVSQ